MNMKSDDLERLEESQRETEGRKDENEAGTARKGNF